MNGNFSYQPQYNGQQYPSFQEEQQQQQNQGGCTQQNTMNQLVAEGNLYLTNNLQQQQQQNIGNQNTGPLVTQRNLHFTNNLQTQNWNHSNDLQQSKLHRTSAIQQKQQQNSLIHNEIQYLDRMITQTESTSQFCQKQLEYIQYQYNQIQGEPNPVLVERYNAIIRQNLVYQSQKGQLEARKSYLLKIVNNDPVQTTQSEKQTPSILQSHSHLLTPPLTPQSPDTIGQCPGDDISSNKSTSKNPTSLDSTPLPILIKVESKSDSVFFDTPKDGKLKSIKSDVIDLTTDYECDEDTGEGVPLPSKAENDSKFNCSTINDEVESIDSAYHSLPPDVSNRVDRLAEEYFVKNFPELVEKLPDVMEVVSEEVTFGSAEFDEIIERETNKLLQKYSGTKNSSVPKNEVKKEEEEAVCDFLLDQGINDQTSMTQEDSDGTTVDSTSDDNLQVELYEEIEHPSPDPTLSKKTNCHREPEHLRERLSFRKEITESCNLASPSSVSSEETSSDSSVDLPTVSGFKSTYSKKNSIPTPSNNDNQRKRKISVSEKQHSPCSTDMSSSKIHETLLEQLQKSSSTSCSKPEKAKQKNKEQVSSASHHQSSLLKKKTDVSITTSNSKIHHKSPYSEDDNTSIFSLDDKDDPIYIFNKRKEQIHRSKDRKTEHSSLKSSCSHEKETRKSIEEAAGKSRVNPNRQSKPSSKSTSFEKNIYETPSKKYRSKSTDDFVNLKRNSPPRPAVRRSCSNDLTSSNKEFSNNRIPPSSTKKMSDDQRMYVADKILKKRLLKKMRNKKSKTTTAMSWKKKHSLSNPKSPVAKKVTSLSFDCYKPGVGASSTPSSSSYTKNRSDMRRNGPESSSFMATSHFGNNGKQKEVKSDFNRNFLSVFNNVYNNDA